MRKWEALTLVLLLSGCASPAGGDRQLRQAAPAYAPMPARAPSPVRIGNTYRPAGTALYGVGEAAPHGEEVQRSPNKRVLPPTREPGLWAADGPRGSGAALNPARLMGYTLPLPLADEGHVVDDLAQLCAAYMETILRDPAFPAVLPAVSSAAQKECLVAKMYHLCAETMRLTHAELEDEAKKRTSSRVIDDWRKWTGETAKVADAYRRAKCSPENDTLAVRKAYSAVHREWIRHQPGAVVPND